MEKGWGEAREKKRKGGAGENLGAFLGRLVEGPADEGEEALGKGCRRHLHRCLRLARTLFHSNATPHDPGHRTGDRRASDVINSAARTRDAPVNLRMHFGSRALQ
eukprot:283108-Rhodomonas_salina.1